MTPTYYLQHPDGSYSVADPQPQQDAQAVVQGWQPIETAPMDGRTVIIGRRMNEFGFVRGYGRFEGKPGSFCSGWISQGFDEVLGNLGLAHPTHWMPLPAPPDAAPTPPAQQPLGWLDRKAVECLQGAELNWMPAWNRPTSADPVPVFLGPPTRATLTASEILNMTPESIPAEHDGALLEYARAVIEAYERKNGLKP